MQIVKYQSDFRFFFSVKFARNAFYRFLNDLNFFILQYNDVAVLTLDSPVAFTKNIRPICLPQGSQNYAGLPATVIGWGSLRESMIHYINF